MKRKETVMVVNKHGSFYMRSGWGTKIIYAIEQDDGIFAPANEAEAVDSLGVGRVMIKAMRYWSDVMGLTTEVKENNIIKKVPLDLYIFVKKYDPYFQKLGTLLLMHRNVITNIDEATAWYWLFNEWKGQTASKDAFVDGLHSYLTINGMKIKKEAVEKEFNCVKQTYIKDKEFDLKTILDEDAYPLLGPLKALTFDKEKGLIKRHLTSKEIPVELLIFSIAMDNQAESKNEKQLGIDLLMEENNQVGKYFNIRYSDLLDMLLEAENKGYIGLNNNFGNRYIEFNSTKYKELQKKYYMD